MSSKIGLRRMKELLIEKFVKTHLPQGVWMDNKYPSRVGISTPLDGRQGSLNGGIEES